MLKKLLIANRGEIACRIIRTARKLGIATVAVYSDADRRAMHVAMADEAVAIGPSPATDSYLRGDKIIAAAQATGADAVHPGYGFLSENADFAEAVVKAGLTFVGPTAAAMRALGGKAAAKEIAIGAGVPVVPGYQGSAQDANTLTAEARKVGFPVMIKAVAGGGGRGMRLVESEAELPELLASAQREAQSAFGNPGVLIEKVVVRPRHIEVQVFGDRHGNVVHLFERDCTLQRRNQKVVEEAPAPGITAGLRDKMCAAAVKLAKSVGYQGAGTVEFLVEGGAATPEPRWYFIEMNTRLQVEHPVTEEITGLDLVEWQLRVASGERLPLEQRDIRMQGHAIEVRLCAEDPAQGFMPSTGPITIFEHAQPGRGTRLETGVRQGDAVSPYYDSMLAKLIVHAGDRTQVIDQLVAEMGKLLVGGVRMNTRFLINLLELPAVRAGDMDTGLIGRELDGLTDPRPSAGAVARGLEAWGRRQQALGSGGDAGPWDVNDAFALGGEKARTMRVAIGGKAHDVALMWESERGEAEGAWWPRIRLGTHADWVETPPAGPVPVRDEAGAVVVFERGATVRIDRPIYDAGAEDDGHAGDVIRAPINGKVAKVFVAEGDAVEKGARVAVVEAMKMEHVLHAARAGTVARVAAGEGTQVNQGTAIVALAEST